MTLRKVISKTRGSFPNAEAAMKLLYLAFWNTLVKKVDHAGAEVWKKRLCNASLSCTATASP